MCFGKDRGKHSADIAESWDVNKNNPEQTSDEQEDKYFEVMFQYSPILWNQNRFGLEATLPGAR